MPFVQPPVFNPRGAQRRAPKQHRQDCEREIQESTTPHTPLDQAENLAQVAQDAAVTLELFSKTKPADDEDMNDEHQQMITSALEGILKIHRQFRIIAARRNGGGEFWVQPEVVAEAKVDSGCIICYSQIADTVLLPCNHLAFCGVYVCSLVA